MLEREKWNEGLGWASITGMPAELWLVLAAAGGERGRGCPTAGQPPSPLSSAGSRICLASFTGVQGNGGTTGCWGSPPNHVRSRCARSESQPIRNIIYNNNNNNINNIRTSGSIFFPSTIWLEAEHPGDMTIGISVSNLAPAQLLQ